MSRGQTPESPETWGQTPHVIAGKRAMGTDPVIVHAMGTDPVIVQSIDAHKVRSVIAGQPRSAILWEVSAENAATVGLAIAQIGVSQQAVLQLAAVDTKQTSQLELRLMELGVRGVVHQTEQLAVFAPLVHRFFESHVTD